MIIRLFTGGRFDIHIKDCYINIYKSISYSSHIQTIRLVCNKKYYKQP